MIFVEEQKKRLMKRNSKKLVFFSGKKIVFVIVLKVAEQWKIYSLLSRS